MPVSGAKPYLKRSGRCMAGAVVVLGEGRVGDHPVELEQVSRVHVERLLQGVAKIDLRVQDVVQDQVHLGDGDHCAVAVLAVKHQVAAIAPLLVHILAGLDQHAAGASGGVVDAHALARLENLDHEPHHLAGRVELAALLACAVGEVFDQVLVGRAQQVGKLEVVVDQHELGLVEVVDQVFELGVGDLALVVDGGVEVDVAQHALRTSCLHPSGQGP